MAQVLTPIATLLNRGIGVADLQAALEAATDTELQFKNSGDLVLFVDNQSAGVRTVTLKAQPDPFGRGGAGVNDEIINIPAGEVGFIPFMDAAMFNSGGIVSVELDAVLTTNIGVYRLTRNT